MKKLSVNLLPTATKFQLSQIRLAKKLKKIAFVLVIVWLTVGAVIFSIKLFLSYRKNTLSKQKKELDFALEGFSPKMELQQALRFRLKLVAEVLKTRPSLKEKLDEALALFPENTEIDTLKIKGGKIDVTGSIGSLSGWADFEERIITAGREEVYKSAELKSLSQGEGWWNFLLELQE